MQETFRTLRNRNFRLFFSGQLISQSGTWLTTIASTLLVLSLTHSGVAVGLLVACDFGPVLLLSAWGGLVADRSDKRRLLVITQTLEMAQSFALAALAFMAQPPLIGLYLVALSGGCLVAFDNPTRKSFVAEMVPEADIQNAVMLNTALMTSARVIGPAIAGALIVAVGFGWCFLIDGVSYLAVITGLLMMRRAELRQPPVVVRARGQLREGLRYVRRMPDLWIPLVMMTVIGTLTFNFTVVLPLFVEHTLDGDAGSFTLLFSVLSVGSVIGVLIIARRRSVDVPYIAYTAFAFGAAMFMLAAAPTLPIAFPFALLVGLTSVTYVTMSQAMMQVRADPTMRGRVLALQAMVIVGSTPVGGPLLGYVCDTLGPRAGIALGAAAAVGAGLWGLYTHRRVLAAADGQAPTAPDRPEAHEVALS
jgi:MFS family permease